jgi:hypothetical protein
MMMSYQLRRAGFCDINRITNGFDSIRFDSIRFIIPGSSTNFQISKQI